FLRDQPRRTLGPKRLQQPPYLALTAPQKLCCCPHRKAITVNIPQHREPPQLRIAHAQHRHRNRPPQSANPPGRLTSLNWTALTFARCRYTLGQCRKCRQTALEMADGFDMAQARRGMLAGLQ